MKEYYRITCNNIGIYEYFKKYLWNNIPNAKEIWNEFINSENNKWLKKPTIYKDNSKEYNSYFNIEGYNMFLEKTLPMITKWIDKNSIKIDKIEIEKNEIIYEDEYQIVIKGEVEKIMDLMTTIKYGFLDKDGKDIFDYEDSNYAFNKNYHLMSPEELLEKRIGVCWDQVELERKLFNDKSIINETYFIYIDDKSKLPSHTFLVYYMNDKIYWFEHSWYDQMGIHEYDNLDQLLNDVTQRFIKNEEINDNKELNVYIYRYNKPNYNISCNEFYEYIFKQDKII